MELGDQGFLVSRLEETFASMSEEELAYAKGVMRQLGMVLLASSEDDKDQIRKAIDDFVELLKE